MRTLALLLLLPALVFADAAIAVEDRVQAMPFGDAEVSVEDRQRNARNCCVWAAAQTIFHGAAGYPEAEGLFKAAVNDRRWWNGANPENLIGFCQREKIPYRVVRKFEEYKKACDEGLGVVLFIPGHALALVGLDETEARIIDNNGPPVIQKWPIRKFSQLAQMGICPDCPSPRRPVGPRPPTTPDAPEVKPSPPHEVKPAPPAPKGEKGDPGPAGPQGPKGDTGPAGPKGDAIPDDVLIAHINRLLARVELQCELYDVDGKLQATSTFGPSKPLRLKLVPVKVAAP